METYVSKRSAPKYIRGAAAMLAAHAAKHGADPTARRRGTSRPSPPSCGTTC
jgi:hypothetical protein